MSASQKQMLVLPETNSRYTHEDRYRVVVAYLMYGNMQKVSEIVNIPKRTLQGWTHYEWWSDLITHVRAENTDEFDAGFSRIISKSMKTIEDQLDSGDVKARDAATIMGISFDKRQILNLKPTTITAKATDINHLQEQFENYLKAKTIDTEVVIVNETD